MLLGRSRVLGLALAVASLWANHAHASASSDEAIARQARELLNGVTSPDNPGVTVLLARGDRIVFRGARGSANLELGVPLAPDQVLRIASVTKMFTAALILKLAESGRLSLDDPLSSHVSDIPNGGSITIRALLNHTAGVSDRAVNPQPGFGRRDVDTATLVGEIARRPPAFAPGARQSYSNAGYILLGAVIERVTGRHWHVAMREQLLEPLGMRSTQYGLAERIIAGRAAGYTREPGGQAVVNAGFMSMTIPAAAGALVSTTDDMLLWTRALTGGRVVNAASYRQMISLATLPGAQPTDPYGFGMYIWLVRGERMVGHTGQVNGFASIVAHLPSRDITIIALANHDDFDARIFGRRLAAIALERPYPKVVARPLSDDELHRLAGSYRFDDSVVQTLSVRDGRLHAQRGGGNTLPLQMSEEGRLHFIPDELSHFVPVRDATGVVTRLDYFWNGEGPPKALPRIPAPAR